MVPRTPRKSLTEVTSLHLRVIHSQASITQRKTNMALLHEGWLIFIASCCVLGFALWTGMDAMTVKLLFLWTFIAFGFVTLILHAFGSSVAKMLSKLRTVFGLSAEKKVNPGEIQPGNLPFSALNFCNYLKLCICGKYAPYFVVLVH